MGEMMKFGIKLAMTIACALALGAALAILFTTLADLISQLPTTADVPFQFVREISRVIILCLPINVTLLFTIITGLFTFKIAYWAADKLIVFIDSIG